MVNNYVLLGKGYWYTLRSVLVRHLLGSLKLNNLVMLHFKTLLGKVGPYCA